MKKGFTLVELMIVILIVAILAAVAVPLMMNRVDAAKWSEAKAAMGTIATGIRTYYAQAGCNVGALTGGAGSSATECEKIGLGQADLDGTYFLRGCYTWSGTCTPATGVITYNISCDSTVGRSTRPTATPTTRTLIDSGTGAVWTPPM